MILTELGTVTVGPDGINVESITLDGQNETVTAIDVILLIQAEVLKRFAAEISKISKAEPIKNGHVLDAELTNAGIEPNDQ